MSDLRTDLKKLAQGQRGQGDFDSAVRTLQEAIYRAGAELADLHGILGGTRREQGDLVSAVVAYDEGFRIDLRYNILSSYNALNRLVTRVMLIPGSLVNPDLLRREEKLEFVDVRHALTQLQAQLEFQVEGERANDFWAAGDLVVAAALNGNLKIAQNAAIKFESCSPPPFAYDSYRLTIATLAQLETPWKECFKSVETLLIPSPRAAAE